MNILIKNGRIIDPANQLDVEKEVYVSGEKIVGIGSEPVGFNADKVIDASGRIVAPGFIDLNISLREPGFEHKATIASETKAAASAGFTSLCCSPNTQPVLDTPSVVQLILDKAAEAGFAKVIPLGALTINLEGKQLSEMYALTKAGCAGFSQAPNNAMSAQTLRRALQYASSYCLPVILKPENVSIRDNGCIHEGAVSARLGLAGIASSAETVAVGQAIALAEEVDACVHLTGVSTAKAVSMLSRAQHDGVKITADVHAYQLHLTELDVGTFDANYHVSPPLRCDTDRDKLIAGVAQGVIQVSSGHQPHDLEAKQAPFPATEAGISGIETVLPLMLRLVEKGSLNLSQVVASLTVGSADIMGLDLGSLSVGATADICIFDPTLDWIVDETTWLSRGKNTPYMGQQMAGQVTQTLVNGRLVFER